MEENSSTDTLEDSINVVIADFVDLDPGYVEAIIGLNYAVNRHVSPTPSPFHGLQEQLSPVLELIRHEQKLQSELVPSSINAVRSQQSITNQLAPQGDVTGASALSSRALTPTPLQFIDAGSNAPSSVVTPLRRAPPVAEAE